MFGERGLESAVRVGTPPTSRTPKETRRRFRRLPRVQSARSPRVQVTVRRRRVHPEPSGDANADANWESERVGCCRSDGPERIQETVQDGSCRVMYAFWKCGIPRQAVSRVRIPLAPRFSYSIRDFASGCDRNAAAVPGHWRGGDPCGCAGECNLPDSRCCRRFDGHGQAGSLPPWRAWVSKTDRSPQGGHVLCVVRACPGARRRKRQEGVVEGLALDCSTGMIDPKRGRCCVVLKPLSDLNQTATTVRCALHATVGTQRGRA
jgi:hypothetical protein